MKCWILRIESNTKKLAKQKNLDVTGTDTSAYQGLRVLVEIRIPYTLEIYTVPLVIVVVQFCCLFGVFCSDFK